MDQDLIELRDAFGAFVKAVKTRDFPSYLSLHDEEIANAVDEELFVRNAERAARHQFAFELDAIKVEGKIATMSFEIVAGDGDVTQNDEAEITWVRRDQGWKLLEV